MNSRTQVACRSALLVYLAVGWIDGSLHVWQHGTPHAVFPLLALLVYGLGGVATGLLGAILSTDETSAGRRAGFLAFLVLGLSALFTRVLPESVEVGTPMGIVALVLFVAAIHRASFPWGRWVSSARVRNWILLGAGAAIVVSGAVWAQRWKNPFPAAEPTDAPPDVLVLVMDTLRADHADPERMPNVAALAAKGVRFERALSVSCFTPPPHATLLTGNYPVQHGVRGGQRFLAEENRTLAEVLSEHGYATVGVVSNLSLASVFGWDQGFGLYDDSLVSSVSPGVWLETTPAIVPLSKLGLSPRLAFLRMAHWIGMVEAVDAAATVDHLLEAMDRVGSRPVFAFVNFMDPHFPYRTPTQRGDAAVDRVNDALEPILRSVGHAADGLSAEVAGEVPRLYDDEVRYLDREVGRLMEAWDRLGRLDRTLVVVTADHGEHLGEHSRYFHTNSLYRELVHVPLVFSFPGAGDTVSSGIEVSETVSLVDVAPTILDWLGVSGGEAMHGESLLPVMRGESRSGRTVVSDWNEDRAIAWDDYKAFFRKGKLLAVTAWNGDETVSLLEGNSDLADDAYRRYREWEDEAVVRGSVEHNDQSVDPAMAERLRALGYVE